MNSIDQVITAYERGLITDRERSSWLIELFIGWLNSGQAVTDFQSRVTTEDYERIIEFFNAAPKSESEWAAYKTLRIQSRCGPPQTKEQKRLEEEALSHSKQNYRRAVETFRQTHKS